MTLNKLGMLQRQIKKWVRRHNQKIMLALDESDEISNPYSKRAKSTLSCFRRCWMKLLTTGTSTRNNISEFAPQLELLYNNSINMITWCREYFNSTGNSRKDAMLRLVQQITLLLRVAAAPNTVREYRGDTPTRIMAATEMAGQWDNEIVAIGVRHQNVLNAYAEAIQEYLPDRPLFTVTGSTKTFAQRRALRKTLRDSGNGILLCTQQSFPSSVNFEYVNKILIPEMHFNNSGMSQFYMRFIRYTSTEYKDIYFLNYTGSLESNLLQMVLAKETINLFMKGQDTDLDQIYEKFGVDYNLLALLMQKGTDKDGRLEIRWGQQKIA